MVATSIFVVVMMASIGSLFNLFGNAKNSRALRFAMDNVNYAMESMTRSLRMGLNYYCGASTPSGLEETMDCTGGGTLVAFVPQNNPNIRITYKWATRANGTKTIERCEGNVCVEVVSSDVNVEFFKFYVRGSSPSDNLQASVYVLVKGSVDVKGVKSSFSIQTLASQRNF